MSTDEVRTTSATGGQKGTKRARFDMIPADVPRRPSTTGSGPRSTRPATAGSTTGASGTSGRSRSPPCTGTSTPSSRARTSTRDGQQARRRRHLARMALAHWMNRQDLTARFDDRQAVLEEQQAAVVSDFDFEAYLRYVEGERR